jgi:dihydrofolate reductase (trimethoprim resistance protein)
MDTPNDFAFYLGQMVRKKRGSQWRGPVCGWYSTDLTPEGYAVASVNEPGNVQIYPVAALEPWDGEADAV